MEDQSVYTILEVICDVKEKFPQKDIWLYTGYKWEDVMSEPRTLCDYYRQLVLTQCDVVVDGKYEAARHDSTLAFRGSANQRIIDVKKTLEAGRVITYDL